jgi:protease I
MSEKVLDAVRIAVIVADGFEQVEVTRPVNALEKQGAEVEIVSLRPGSIQGMNLLFPGKKVHVDQTVFTADPNDYDGLLIPGGYVSPDTLRQSEAALDFVRTFDSEGKPIATICHGPWVLISAGLVRGRRLASWPGIKDDVRNAGGIWVDDEVVFDDSWISSRGPQDLRAFDKAIVAHYALHTGRVTPRLAGDVGWGRWLVGTMAVAAAGYAVRRRLRHSDDGNARRPIGNARGRAVKPAEFASTY